MDNENQHGENQHGENNHGFFRALRKVFAYRWSLAIALACSVLVAVMWGANLGTVYPFIEVVFRGKSLRAWVDEEITKCETTITKSQAQLAELRVERKQAAGGEKQALTKQIDILQARLEAETQALSWRQWMRPHIYRWLPAQPYTTLMLVVAMLLIGTVLKDGFTVVSTVLVERSVRKAMLSIRKDYFDHALRLDLASLHERGAGDVTSRFSYDMHVLTNSLGALFGRATVEPLKMLACLIGAGLICWRLLVFSLILAPPAVFLVHKLAGSLKRANRRALEEMSRLVGQLGESLDSVQVVQAFTMEPYESKKFFARAHEFYRRTARIVLYGALTKPATELLGISVICIALLAGAYLVLEQETHLFGVRMTDRPLGLAALLAFYALLAGISDPARKMADIYNHIQPGVPAAERIYALIDQPVAIADPPRPRSLPKPHSKLTFENISFRYRTGGLVVQELDLEIPFGQSLAIVGPNGCGKSTLVNMVPRFFDPTAGSVKLDGIDLRELRLADLRGRIGLVSQHTQLFDDTVMNNIRYGTLAATDEQVIEAAKRAHAHRFITEKLADGYQTMVGAKGGRLSGGQRQRIALARAILRDPEILILDEATSAIDIESEQLIHQVLEEFIVGRTAIIITHRLSTLTLADRILVMDAGRILDIGTHQQLMNRSPLYQKLHEIQFRQSA